MFPDGVEAHEHCQRKKVANAMKILIRRLRWLETIAMSRRRFSRLLIYSILIISAALSLGMIVGILKPVYGFAIAGALVLVIVVLLRWDDLAVTLIVAVHLWIDWYLALHLVGILAALLLVFAYYFGRSADHPWVGPRPLWLWILFLTLTIYPAINGGRLLLYDAATVYPSLILGACLMFCLGSTIAKDISTLRRALQMLSFVAALIAIHTIIEATTGIFLFATSHENLHLLTASNLEVAGTNAARAGSFFADPLWNGCFLATIFFLPLGLFMESNSPLRKLLFFTEMLLIVVALTCTYSNGSWIALLCGTAVFGFWVGSHHHRFLWILSFALIALLMVIFFSPQLSVEIQHASTPDELSLRLGAWQTGIQVIKAFPLFGTGLGSQAYLTRSSPYRVFTQYRPLDQPHDSYIQWGAMAGIPVMLVFLSLLGYAFWRSWCNWRAVEPQYRPLLGGGITALIALSINSISIDGWTNAVIAVVGWLIFGMLSSPLLRGSSQKIKQQEQITQIAREEVGHGQ
jgi:O-antigen ligase